MHSAAEPRPQPVMAGLTTEQAKAAAQYGPVLVLAGAGTGKTKTLTAAVVHRIAAGGVAPGRVLAVTFTNKAATEMSGRIRAALDSGPAPSWLGTFHGLAARQLRIEPEVAGLRPGFDILDADDSRRVVKRTLKTLNLASGEDAAAIGRDPLKLMCSRLSKFKDNLITPDEAPAQVEAIIAEANRSGLPVDAHGLRASARVYADYQRRLRDANAADFGDLLLWPARAMQRSESYRTRWASRFDWVLADEFQDVNLAQFTWLRLLAAQHDEIFVVGDDDQSVYGWRGADVGYIRRFTRDFPNAAVYRLEENFRSTGHILGAANTVIAQDPARLGKTLFTRKPGGDPVEIVRFRNADAEASVIVSEISRRQAEGLAWDDMAVLYRSNALSRSFEEALMHARIPYALIGDVGFYQRAEIKDALALLRLAAAPDDAQADEAFRRVINVPARSFGAKAMDIVEVEAAWRRVPLLVALETAPLPPKARAAGLGFVDAIRRAGRDPDATLADQLSLLLDATGYRGMLRDSRAETSEGRLGNLQELVQLAGGFHTARELLDHAALSTGGPDEEETGRVQLMTLHKAKGLEFPHVFLPAWEAGVFPPDYGEPAEERRLAYVAITRGMHRVTISYCDYRRGPATPSLFLDNIPDRHRVAGWLHQPGAAPVPVRRRVDRLNAAELLQRF
jgi:DNA helicase-2/ATP-dependent DNA helicase PcrA